MPQDEANPAGLSAEKEAADHSDPTLLDMIRHIQMAGGCPDPATDRAVTLAWIGETYPEDAVIWVLQEWVRGGLEGYDPVSLIPVLAPRGVQDPKIAWNYVAGSLPSPGLGGTVRLGKLPTRLPLYGAFRFDSDRNWSFLLHDSDRPAIRRIAPDRPATFTIPVQSETPGAEENTGLFLRVERDAKVGLAVSAQYNGLRWQGVSRAIHDLAQNCLRARVFSREIAGHRDAVLWGNAIAWFFSMVFSRDLPARMADLAEEGSPENQVIRQARSAIAVRLGTMIFDRDRVETAIAAFWDHPVPLFPWNDIPQMRTSGLAVEKAAVTPSSSQESTALTTEVPEPLAEPEGGAADIYELMEEKLPELLPRSKLPKMCEELLGAKLLGKSTLEKLDMRNEGPPKLEVGGRIHYSRAAFIQWYRKWNHTKSEN
ncbi:MAG: hypothetical protein RBS99_17455 [Rhodospirillales bacterium]|jgi:hypothetical protein|nr:hypothetical protein [Rhodospirillales bacterium]